MREIVGVTGRVEGDVIETADIFTTRNGRLERADGYPPHPERFAAVGVDLAELLGQPRPAHPRGRGVVTWARSSGCCSASGCC